MHSVLVVDDEPFVRLSIASLRDWEREGFSFRFEAGNGREALEALDAHPEIDIVLLDISMPVMDGIEFLRRMAAGEGVHPGGAPAVLILSAYDEFHLVRTAFTLGAADYVLKTEMDGESLLALLRKTALGIEESRERSSAIVERKQVEVLRRQVLRDLLVQPIGPESRDAIAGLGISLAPPVFVCAFWIRDFEDVARRYEEEELSRFDSMVERSLAQILAKRGSGEVVPVRPGHVAVLFSGGEEQARLFCADAKDGIERYLSVRASCSIGEARGGLEDAPGAYKSAVASRGVESRIIVAAKRFIRERFADPELSLAEVAERAGVSKNHLSWEFARETGETLTEYVALVRVEEAKRLLRQTSLKVYEIGERVGYPNVEHFSRVFKKLTGTSPSAWTEEADASGRSGVEGAT